MRILVSTPTFAPLIGGVPTVADLLARGLAGLGAEVTLVTGTRADRPDDLPYPVIRAPDAARLIAAVRDCEVVLQHTVSLRLGWPLSFVRRPVVVAHHMWIGEDGSPLSRIKRATLRHVQNISVSDAVARSLGVPSTVIPNPYDESTFTVEPAVGRTSDLVFVGRLIPDKGLHVALEALDLLRTRGRTPGLSVIGSGPEEPALRAECHRLGIDRQVSFLGPLQGPDLAMALNRHRLLLVPSVWEEPFGIVALEGIACGLVPIVSRSGGLPGAIGACGKVVPSRDARALAAAIQWLLEDGDACSSFRAAAATHLARHTRTAIASEYLRVLQRALDVPS